MSRKPYFRPVPASWWLKSSFYAGYMIRELTSVFIGAYTLVLLIGIIRLSQGEFAYNGFLDALNHPLSIVFHVVSLLGVTFHSVTWFGVAPKAMPLQFTDELSPPWVVTLIHYIIWAIVSIFVLFVVFS
jgi:fumarate reductase subunit C